MGGNANEFWLTSKYTQPETLLITIEIKTTMNCLVDGDDL